MSSSSSSLSPLSLFSPPWAAEGTGLLEVVNITQSTYGSLPPTLVAQIVPFLPGLFGDYPNKSNDIGPSALFVALFAIMGFANLYVCVRNWMSGYKTYSWVAMTCYAFSMMIGFALRLQWAQDVLQVRLGVASVVFTQLPMLILNSMCFLYGERIFAWRHPQTAHSRWFKAIILGVYVLVVGIIVMAIVAQAVPFLYFLTPKHYKMCQQVTQAAAILNLLYGMTGSTLVQIAFLFKPGTIDHRMFRYPSAIAYDENPNMAQATWIERTSLLYFPPKGCQIPAPKNSYRVMPTRQAPHGGIANLLNGLDERAPSVVTATLVVLGVSLMLTFSLCFRAASVFVLKPRGGFLPTSFQTSGPSMNSFTFRNYVFYIWYGAFQLLVNVIFLVFRCDLRFCIPPASNEVVETPHLHAQDQPDFVAGEKESYTRETEAERGSNLSGRSQN